MTLVHAATCLPLYVVVVDVVVVVMAIAVEGRSLLLLRDLDVSLGESGESLPSRKSELNELFRETGPPPAATAAAGEGERLVNLRACREGFGLAVGVRRFSSRPPP